MQFHTNLWSNCIYFKSWCFRSTDMRIPYYIPQKDFFFVLFNLLLVASCYWQNGSYDSSPSVETCHIFRCGKFPKVYGKILALIETNKSDNTFVMGRKMPEPEHLLVDCGHWQILISGFRVALLETWDRWLLHKPIYAVCMTTVQKWCANY